MTKIYAFQGQYCENYLSLYPLKELLAKARYIAMVRFGHFDIFIRKRC